MPKSHWNYRVIEHLSPIEGEPPFFQIHEVYYTDSVPHSYTVNGANVGGETKDEMLAVLERMKNALDKPLLKATQFTSKESNDDVDSP